MLSEADVSKYMLTSGDPESAALLAQILRVRSGASAESVSDRLSNSFVSNSCDDDAGSFESTATTSSRRSSLLERRVRRNGKELSIDCSIAASEVTQKQNDSTLSSRFEVFEQLGQGSAATVYRARQFADRREVALKWVRTQDEEKLAHAHKEYTMLKEVEHPHIIGALDFFTFAQGAIIVLEYYEGSFTLEDGLAKVPGGLREPVARRLFEGLLKAIAHVHQQGIIHRDVKVQNVLVSGDSATGELHNLRLVDFNTAERVVDCGALTMTGTPDYLPPEVLLGDSHTELSDVWAAGLCLHYMLSGTLPWERSDFRSNAEFGWAVKDRTEAPLSGEKWQHLSADSRRVVRRCLHVDQHHRPPAAELLKDFAIDPHGDLLSL